MAQLKNDPDAENTLLVGGLSEEVRADLFDLTAEAYVAMLNGNLVIFPHLDWLTISVALNVALVVSTFASWFPASASAKLNPVEALMET